MKKIKNTTNKHVSQPVYSQDSLFHGFETNKSNRSKVKLEVQSNFQILLLSRVLKVGEKLGNTTLKLLNTASKAIVSHLHGWFLVTGCWLLVTGY